MRIDALLPRQQGCIQCPEPLPCNCAEKQDCIQINRDCNTCSQTVCIAKPSSGRGNSGGGVSKGATAGAIICTLLFLAISVSLFLWYRRRIRLRNAKLEPPNDVPASAETVLNRPDPIEKPVSTQAQTSPVPVNNPSSNPAIDLDPKSQHPSPIQNVNPFDDATSIQTAGTEGTNVIPIALVPSSESHISEPLTEHSTSTYPVRPARTPGLNLNLEHVNVSRDSVRGPAGYARSAISGISSRNSYISNASYSSDFLNEAPMIITPNKGAVRQVVGVVKAEVINAPGSLSSDTSDRLKPPSTSRPAIGSPLASTSFGPADVVKELDEGQTTTDPFGDEISINADYGESSAPSIFGRLSPGPIRDSHSGWVVESPNVPWIHSSDDSRPSSMSTQAGSVIDIGSATRVKIGDHLNPNDVRAPFRATMGKLVSPSTANSGSLGEQQQRALAHAQAQTQVQAQGSHVNRRVSSSSAVSTASTRADSILESFPFVPPSPISNRPIRSPPVSPLGKQSFTSDPPPLPTTQHIINILPPSPLPQGAFGQENTKDDSVLPPPPDRRTLGLSTGSQLSTASSGLGSFPFQIDSGDGNSATPSPFNTDGRQRASLDTLALTNDLSSYPLGFERDSVQVPLPKP